MTEIAAASASGFVAATLFAGCGGSCLGLRMAGFDVRWANECDPAARMSYEPNHPGCALDPRDVREVRGADILAACGVEELDMLDGSPPCVSFSMAGRRAASWGAERAHAGIRQRTDDLFLEYLRLVDEVRPRTFIAENVSGMVKGVAKGWFLDVLERAKALGYRVRARLLDAQWLGVPQGRQRVIFVGVRDDLDIEPTFPKPLPYRYSLHDACPRIIKGSVRHSDTLKREWFDASVRPSPTVSSQQPYNPRTSTQGLYVVDVKEGGDLIGINDLKRICSFPDDFVLVGTYAEQWARLGNSVPPLMMRAIAERVRDDVLLPARNGS